MLISSGANRIKRLDEGGPVLGVLPSATYSAGIVRIREGDTLVIYSDGIEEAANGAGEEFGETRVAELARAASSVSPAELCHRIISRVSAFTRAGRASDDRTLMVVKILPPATALTA